MTERWKSGRAKKPMEKQQISNSNKIWTGALALLFGAVYSLFFNLLLSFFSANTAGVADEFLNEFFKGSLVLYFLATVIFAPVMEEFLFRKLLYGFLKKKLGVLAALLISAVVFAALHIIPVQIVFALFIGIFAVLVLEAGNSWIHAILLHVAVNAAGFLVNQFPAVQNALLAVRLPVFIASAVLTVTLAVYFVIQSGIFRKKTK